MLVSIPCEALPTPVAPPVWPTPMNPAPDALPAMPPHPGASSAVGRGWRFGQFSLLPDRRQLLQQGQPVTLGGRALDVLLLLIEHHQRVVAKDEILDRVWKQRCVEESNIPVQIAHLRRLLGEDCIQTIPQRGYQFTAVLHPLHQVDREPPLERPASPHTPQVLADPAFRPPIAPALIGRRDTLTQALRLLKQHPSLALVGPVGVGKSALAAALAQAWADQGLPVAWLRAQAQDDESALQQRLHLLLHALSGRAALPSWQRASAAGLGPLVVLDDIDRWSPAVRALARQVLGREAGGLRVLVTCPGRSGNPLDATLALPTLRLYDALAGSTANAAADEACTDSAHGLLRLCASWRHAHPNKAMPPQQAELSLCQILDGRPGLLTVVARWVALTDAQRAAAWLVRDPAVLGQTPAADGVRPLAHSLQASLALLNDAGRLAYQALAQPARPPRVEDALRLLRRKGLTQADALAALTDLLELHLLRWQESDRPGHAATLLMPMPERWHALGRLGDAG